ncbi:MAG: hypothetical protein IJE59_04895 [Clostridia bacterium]|nr:hypothetical protein [Clostridia bacterium]
MENASKALIIAGAILISILLITIGIILINSGRDVVDTGTSGMTSQKIQTFNSQFTAYEGKRKGSEIRSLINAVNASNATDSEHQVIVYGPVTSAGAITSSKTYTVEVHYNGSADLTDKQTTTMAGPSAVNSEKGYIDYINIK